ncbi:MAG: hypothetical protein K0U71_04030, partial [Actinomycetia bacterium]|nr:hypothetical protein [Actinomycetes bacterium]
ACEGEREHGDQRRRRAAQEHAPTVTGTFGPAAVGRWRPRQVRQVRGGRRYHREDRRVDVVRFWIGFWFWFRAMAPRLRQRAITVDLGDQVGDCDR